MTRSPNGQAVVDAIDRLNEALAPHLGSPLFPGLVVHREGFALSLSLTLGATFLFRTLVGHGFFDDADTMVQSIVQQMDALSTAINTGQDLDPSNLMSLLGSEVLKA